MAPGASPLAFLGRPFGAYVDGDGAETTYWDSSSIVGQSREAYARLLQTSSHMTLSHLTELEVVSAVARRHKRDLKRRARLERAVLAFCRRLNKLAMLAQAEALFRSARDLARKHALGSNDSLHLAACLFLRQQVEDPVVLASLDRDLREAAAGEGLRLFPPA